MRALHSLLKRQAHGDHDTMILECMCGTCSLLLRMITSQIKVVHNLPDKLGLKRKLNSVEA